jgi:sensor histidine kinase YesM
MADGRLRIVVADDGPGADRAASDGGGDGTGDGTGDSGHGLALVRRRLAVRHGGRAQVSVVSTPGRGFRVTLEIPQEDDE